MAYRYDPVRSPYVGSIGDMIAREGEIRARAAMESGHAWAGAAQNIGNIVSNAITTANDPRRRLENIAATNAEQEQAGQATLTKLQTPTVPNGPMPEGETATPQNPYMKKEGDTWVWDTSALGQAMAEQGKPLTPGLLKSITDFNATNREEMAHRQQFAGTQQKLVSQAAGIMAGFVRAHPDIDLAQTGKMIGEQFAANNSFPIDKFNAALAQVTSDPNTALAKLDALAKLGASPTKLSKDEVLIDANNPSAPPMASNMVTEPGKGDYTINGQRFKADGTPIGDAVPKQVEPPKVGSPEDFIATYAKEKFGKPAASLNVAEKAEALGAFKAANADQDMRAAALAQKNLALVLAQMKEGQQPTAEDAKTVAEDLVNHRQSPSQVKLMFGTRGQEGQAFMLKVNTAAKALDPTFNYEEAESSYQLAKSTGFQNTVRYMDSVQESMPRLLTVASKLGRGNFRSWNEIQNATASQFNAVDLKKLKVDALLVGDEVAKILSGGGSGSATSDAKLKQATELISASDSVPALAGALGEIDALIGYRRKALTRGTYMEGTSAAKTTGDAPKAPAGWKYVPKAGGGWTAVEAK